MSISNSIPNTMKTKDDENEDLTKLNFNQLTINNEKEEKDEAEKLKETMKEVEKIKKENEESEENDKEKAINDLKKLYKLFTAVHTMNIIKNDKLPIQIIDNLYIGSIGAANNKDELLKCGITHILTAAMNIKCLFEDTFKYLKINVLDSPSNDIKQYFSITNTFINEAILEKGSVFVHCHAGISRSSSFIIAYLIEYKQMSLNEALDICKKKRSKINPNEGFLKQLREFETEIRSRVLNNELKE